MPDAWRKPFASSETMHVRMSRQRRRDTAAELAVRRELFGRGLRYRVHRRPVPELRRQADIVFSKRRVAVFVDGCFWHGCPEHGVRPSVNEAYWCSKLEANKSRDRDTDMRLEQAGWRVVHVWEHELPSKVADVVESAVVGRPYSHRKEA